MKYQIIEIIETVPWSAGSSNAPADLVAKAKQLAEEGKPATFGKVDGKEEWVVLGTNKDNALYVAYRSAS